MNTIQRICFAVAVSSLTASSAFAMTMIQKSEPMHGFTRGANPEWMRIKTDSSAFDMHHREYQRDAEAERVLWLRKNESMIGTAAYTGAKRQFLQHRNLMHRLWVLQEMKGMKMMKPSVQTEPMMPSVDLNPDASLSERAFTGNAPSRRAIVDAADDRNEIRATMVGY
jgi:hypothetical protein